MLQPQYSLFHPMLQAALAAASAACFTWFALCCWYQSVFASLHRIVRNGSQSAADLLDWRYNLLTASGGQEDLDWRICQTSDFHDLFDAASQRLWPHAAQSAALIAAVCALLFAGLRYTASLSGHLPFRNDGSSSTSRSTLALAMFAGVSSAAVTWYIATPRPADFPTAHLPDPLSLSAILAASIWHILVVLPLLFALAAALAAKAPIAHQGSAPSAADRVCPRCGYNAQHLHRCPECGLLASRFSSVTRTRILRLLAVPIALLVLIGIPAAILMTYATHPRTAPVWAVRASTWLRLRHTDLVVTGQHMLPPYTSITSISLANGDRWEILPFFAMVTTPEDVARVGGGGGTWAYLVRRVPTVSSPATTPAAVVGAGITPPSTPFAFGGNNFLVYPDKTSLHLSPTAIVGNLRVDAPVTSLSTRPMRPLDFTQPPPPSDSSIEAQLARTLAERKWIWYPAIPKP